MVFRYCMQIAQDCDFWETKKVSPSFSKPYLWERISNSSSVGKNPKVLVISMGLGDSLDFGGTEENRIVDRVSERRELLRNWVSEICRRFPLESLAEYWWEHAYEEITKDKESHRNVPGVHPGPRIVYVSKLFLTLGTSSQVLIMVSQ